ncbi:TonB-dependent receptor [Emticicia oligotrophica DSM 17448]|uniref:TonB-dependent receptor n=1 Tax=Emticicia oligotrophica (strain DSM 17448 / CIP 109782 / MTCC 6937 / GPTSA100-15) TaxID=929562 RepID=A0ABM5N1W7_EMTOG|nr:outer membrane beta-barrel family protein [Emticicia oligotrophica]AFK03418.1 TonB-dependent receptor [Emticicia oligotrophica DSM 17448]
MKRLLSALFTALITITSFAQMPTGGAPAGAKMPEGKLFGKIVDEQGKPVEFASVVLLKTTFDNATKQSKDVLVKAQSSELNGDFNFSEVPVMAKLKLKISSVGYKTLELPVTFAMPKMEGMTPPKAGQQPDPAMIAKMMAAFDKDLGNIKIESDTKVLDAVTVTAQKALLEMDIDKKTFNVEKNIVTAGGTGVDVMRNIPSLQVDIDGNVKLRNAAPTIFIDGRPTTLSLDQIPADAIEKVEVITNPSAKYDASGSMAGILNIILKKNKKSGYNGMLNIGADRFGGSNAMGSISVRQKKWNVTLMGMNMRMRNNTEGNSERTSSIGGINSNVMQDIESKTKGMMTFGRLGVDYNISNRTTLSVGTVIAGGKFRPSEDILITNTTSGKTTVSNRLSESERSFKPRGLQLGLKHNFPTSGEELSMDFNYFGGKNAMNGVYTTNYYNASNQITGTQIQRNIGNGENQFMTFQTDYTKPFKNGMNLETGIRAQINNLQNINDNSLKAVGSDVYKNITSASANYDSKNSVYAAYASVSGKVSTMFSYKVGLRAESSSYEGKLLNTGQNFSNSYPISLFPSVFISKNLSKTDQLQLSVTRRVNRPNFFQLIPFIDYSDSLNITRGNANLVPEFTTSGEISYSKSQGTGTFLASAYYKHTNNLITRYLNQEINPISGKLDLINTYINANSSINYGAEFTYSNKVQKWWDLTANINFYNSKINTDNIDNAVATSALWTVFGKLNNNFNLPKKWVIQLSGDYQGKTNMPVTQNQGFGPPMSQAQSSSQGYIKPFYGVDFAVKKTFLKNDLASLTLSVNDIFRTRGNTQVSYGEGFSQTYYRLTNPQMVKLNLSIRFGKMDMSMFKKNNNTNSMEGMQMQ